MTERLSQTGSGFPTVYAGERSLHSRYNPREEGEKYARSLHVRPGIRFCILIEPCLGYIIPPLRERFPAAAIIALHVSDFFASAAAETYRINADRAWNPGSGRDLEAFLEETIPDTAAREIAILEWRPALEAYGREYLAVFSTAADFVKRIDANTRTVQAFGRRWLRNAFKNLNLAEKGLLLQPGSLPWAVTGAGPSLEEAVPLIKKGREKQGLRVLAAASSAPALLAAGIRPDLILSADGGSWALFHLIECLRSVDRQNLSLAANLTAALPSQCGHLPTLFIGDGSLWQSLLLKESGLPFVTLPSRGTVTATALDLAFLLTKGKVFLAGMDLSLRDIRTHVRLYSFDKMLEREAGRLKPLYSAAFERAARAAASGSYGIYAAWFKRRLASYPGLCSLGGNNPVFQGLEETGIAMPGIRAAPDEGREAGEPVMAEMGLPKGAVKRALASLLGALEKGTGGLAEELAPMLCGGEEKAPITAAELMEEIRGIAAPYIGAACG